MTLQKPVLKLLAMMCFVSLSTLALAANPIYIDSSNKLAIGGYDTVAYFSQSQAVMGVSAHSTYWKGATWHFSSQENKDLFIQEPEKYAPQYGGYCAYALAKNKLYKIEPEQFTIVEDKLYLNLNQATKAKWRKRSAKYIKKANLNWPKIIE